MRRWGDRLSTSSRGVRGALLACLLVAVGGCNFTPEQALLAEVRRLGETWVQTPIEWTSVEVLQTVE